MAPCEGGAFRLAAARGDIPTMQALADGGRRFHVDADHEGFTPLHAAAVEGKAGALLWLCQHGADVTALKDDGWKDTALHYAAARGHMHCCQVLLAFGAQLDAVNYAGTVAAAAEGLPPQPFACSDLLMCMAATPRMPVAAAAAVCAAEHCCHSNIQPSHSLNPCLFHPTKTRFTLKLLHPASCRPNRS